MINSTNFSLLLPEVIDLEPEYFRQAREISDKVTGEAHQWQTYLNALALQGFEQWLSQRIPEQKLSRLSSKIKDVFYLKLGEFKLCLMATEHLLDEVVNFPQALFQPEAVAHLYVILEVLEEEEQVIVRGFLPHEQLMNYQIQYSRCELPLALFDTSPNRLLYYCRLLEPTAISLPGISVETKAEVVEYLKETRTKLSQWLQGIVDSSWSAIDALINPEANLAWSTRTTELSGIKKGKLINLGMQLDNQNVVLLVNVTEEIEEKLSILIQVHPTGEARYLPPHLKLSLLSKAEKVLQEVESRMEDNYIQLKSFKGEAGKRFSIEVSLSDVKVRENFEL